MQKNNTFFVNGKVLLIGASSTWEECESAKEALKIMSRVQGGADTSETQTRYFQSTAKIGGPDSETKEISSMSLCFDDFSSL